jgi:hypothetical protein
MNSAPKTHDCEASRTGQNRGGKSEVYSQDQKQGFGQARHITVLSADVTMPRLVIAFRIFSSGTLGSGFAGFSAMNGQPSSLFHTYSPHPDHELNLLVLPAPSVNFCGWHDSVELVQELESSISR